MTSRGRWLAVVAIACMSPASSGWGQTVEQTGNSSCRACSAAERSRCICTQGNAADNGSPPSAARGIPTVRGATYNRNWYCGDLSKLPIKEDKVQGQITLHVTPDLWVPVDHRGFTINIAIEASLRDDQRWDGSWKRVGISTEDESTRDFGTGGKLTGVAKPGTTGPLPDPVTFECRMQGSLVGGDPTYGDRCMVLWLGLEDGRLVSTIQGRLNQKWTTYGLKAFTFAGNSAAADHDRLSARITVPTTTLDMEPCRYVFELEGRRLDEVLVGTYRLTVEVQAVPISRLPAASTGVGPRA